ncbi:dynamin family protein [cf. Phormidesmis sp. LEGE 11477]|uniref:dynamin family protein n=1 Tax=cf. Phormidesmis sp. LEGE 11477 TaxID=1828680 RepID=UPI00188243A7|nr:dynamin family protein [cf. Phormidesmis sp. LEGE 11477]MBE9059451.1 dynamin family protein [cf. Phormidesmis sp. LEGE 11477]
MNDAIVDPILQRYKLAITQLLDQLNHFAQAIDNATLTKTVQNLQENINQPFLFVVIGEVKAGKSSFINALLGSGEICEVGADPRTNMVAKIVYTPGEGYSREIKPGELREIGRPVPILKQIAIVDTPGTNSPFQKHEDITKEFIPNSDLVIFVFFSKNPYTNTAWSLVDFAHKEWRKPVIFVLQQADLADDRELQASEQYISQEAQQRQIANPSVFATSAKLAVDRLERDQLASNRSENEDAGFTLIQDFIRSTITGGQGYRLKLTSNIGAAEQIVNRLGDDMQLIKQQLYQDEAVVAKIRDRLGQGQSQSHYEIDALVERLMVQYERTIYQIKQEFRDGLSIFTLAKRSVLSIFNRKQRIETWMNDLKTRAQKELEETLDETSKEGAKRFIDSIQSMIKQLLAEVTTLENDALRKTEITLPMLEYRYEVIESVKNKISTLLNDETFMNCLSDTVDGVGPGVAGGGLLAVIGGTIAAVTEVVILDIIGSVFLGVGVLLAGGVLVAKRRRLIQKLDTELERNKARFEATVSEQLNARLSGIYDEIGASFVDLYDYVDKERESLTPLIHQFEQIQRQTKALAADIRQL